MAEYVTLKKNDGTIIYPQVADGSISSSKLEQSVDAGTVVFSYTQDADATSDQTVVVPLDFSTYRKFTVDIAYGVGSSASSGYSHLFMMADAGGTTTAICSLGGSKVDGGSTVAGDYNLNVTNGEMFAPNVSAGQQIAFHVDILRHSSQSCAWGGWANGGTGFFFRTGRAYKSGGGLPGSIKHVMKKPLAGGFFKVVGYK